MANCRDCDVLIVDDERALVEEMAEGLGRAGLRVETALNGVDACELAARVQPRVAIVDYNLPDTVGTTVAQQIRKVSPHSSVILMSGRIDGIPEDVAAETGILAFVNKPLPLGVLRHAIMKLARGSDTRHLSARPSWLSLGLGSPRSSRRLGGRWPA